MASTLVKMALLLYGPLSRGSWPKKLAESRAAYDSLKSHFLRYIEHPNNLHSSSDPLADDDNSPWSTLRQDEIAREEIFQDVTRCMQDNYFFREPATQKRLLDILFIYSKLNPDVGYRQGMHELLAPILWVVQQDAVDPTSVPAAAQTMDDVDFMQEALGHKYVEHDSFSLFCAVMQNAKGSYETGDSKDASPIIARSKKIHDDILAAVDPELALHLHVVGILPQIYSIRWIRLLFGREFEFQEVLRVWDLLFAENLRPDIVDLTCVAMLLRSRWTLIDADYTTAITALTHYTLPHSSGGPRSLVRDAVFLERNRTIEAGATVIQHYTGRRPKQTDPQSSRSSSTARTVRSPQLRQSPSHSPGRFTSSQKQLESLFQEVTGGLQKRTEGWNVSKAVRSAVGEVRRNMNNYQTSHSRQTSRDTPDAGKSDSAQFLQQRLNELQERNHLLSKMLEDAVDSLRTVKLTTKEGVDEAEHNLNISLAKIQFVSVYLADPEIPIPKGESTADVEVDHQLDEKTATAAPAAQATALTGNLVRPKNHEAGKVAAEVGSGLQPAPARPSLMDSSFSFMLGENRHRSSFVSSVAALPEQERGNDLKSGQKMAAEDEKRQQDGSRKGSAVDDGGFTLAKIQGGRQG
ncbi:hypothetical protein PV08_06543 [Exophiala spinifera]|uniref:Rab-GAP TBC domain-containing protein n=1 Tax=Exophiala spinifera TaxID=91928 RepID=A0A0D2BBY5_9EURO|nr:uncharacterized protein PV08_06543 [Exophiala spinifera]KIW16488.1 hypothetical protein PV08_06543 [Exophiala spinifera]